MLYEEALAAGGNLIMYAGGDIATQQDGTRQAFLKQFPKMQLSIIVDYSKYHDARLDNQFATKSLVPDIIQLQTLQNFPRWKQEGRLFVYKPNGFAKIYDKFKDPQGAWMAVGVIAFSFMYDVAAIGDTPPKSPKDLILPLWKKLPRLIPTMTMPRSIYLSSMQRPMGGIGLHAWRHNSCNLRGGRIHQRLPSTDTRRPSASPAQGPSPRPPRPPHDLS